MLLLLYIVVLLDKFKITAEFIFFKLLVSKMIYIRLVEIKHAKSNSHEKISNIFLPLDTIFCHWIVLRAYKHILYRNFDDPTHGEWNYSEDIIQKDRDKRILTLPEWKIFKNLHLKLLKRIIQISNWLHQLETPEARFTIQLDMCCIKFKMIS